MWEVIWNKPFFPVSSSGRILLKYVLFSCCFYISTRYEHVLASIGFTVTSWFINLNVSLTRIMEELNSWTELPLYPDQYLSDPFLWFSKHLYFPLQRFSGRKRRDRLRREFFVCADFLSIHGIPETYTVSSLNSHPLYFAGEEAETQRCWQCRPKFLLLVRDFTRFHIHIVCSRDKVMKCKSGKLKNNQPVNIDFHEFFSRISIHDILSCCNLYPKLPVIKTHRLKELKLLFLFIYGTFWSTFL